MILGSQQYATPNNYENCLFVCLFTRTMRQPRFIFSVTQIFKINGYIFHYLRELNLVWVFSCSKEFDIFMSGEDASCFL